MNECTNDRERTEWRFDYKNKTKTKKKKSNKGHKHTNTHIIMYTNRDYLASQNQNCLFTIQNE